jgi:hypothetical protein
MKIKSIIAGLLLSAVAANASIVLSGAALMNSTINGYTTGVFVSSDSGSFDDGLTTSQFRDGFLNQNLSLTAGSTFGNYTVLGTSNTINVAGASSVLFAGISYDLGGNISTGNEIGVLVFENSTASTVGGDAYSVYTNNWLTPADGANGGLQVGPFTGAAALSGTVVPEPSSYALLGGLLALGCVMLRRRA